MHRRQLNNAGLQVLRDERDWHQDQIDADMSDWLPMVPFDPAERLSAHRLAMARMNAEIARRLLWPTE